MTRLTVDPNVVRRKLSERLALGEELLNRSGDELREGEQQWFDYNRDFLSKAFDDQTISANYVAERESDGGDVATRAGKRRFTFIVASLILKPLQRQVNYLKSLRDRIELFGPDGVIDLQPMTVDADPIDDRILRALDEQLPAAAASYRQALTDLGSTARFSWRGPAADLREALRETLDFLAPDAVVVAQPGFALEEGARGPTMKQKVRYILRERKISASVAQTSESAVVAVDEALGSFVRSVYTRSSVSTHTPTDKGEVVRIKNLVRVALVELLDIP